MFSIMSIRNPDARLHAPVLEGELASGLQPGRSEFSRRRLEGLNYQVTLAVEIRVPAIVRVDFQFLIAPSVAAEIVHPFRRIGRRACRAAEFVTPD
jgi:hypothetical protein